MRLVLALLLALSLIAVGDARHDAHRAHQDIVKQHDVYLNRINELEATVSELRRDNDDLRNRLSNAAELDRARKIRASRSRRATALPSVAWAHQTFSIQVANCESADFAGWPHSDGSHYFGDAHRRDPNGHYGKWQFAPETWHSVGGVGNAADATEAEQDFWAWLLWKRDGWSPWSCHTMV